MKIGSVSCGFLWVVVHKLSKIKISLYFFSLTGETRSSLACQFRDSQNLISAFTPEVCQALYEVLKHYVQIAFSAAELRQVAKEYFMQWNYPTCLGDFRWGKEFSLIILPSQDLIFMTVRVISVRYCWLLLMQIINFFMLMLGALVDRAMAEFGTVVLFK